MAIYTVLAPPSRDGRTAPDGAAADPLDTVFVKEGIAWPALFFAGLWMIYRRMWLVLAGYVALALVLTLLIERAVGGALPTIVLMMAHLLLTLEGNELRRWTLKRRGYRFVGVVEGRGLEEAEIRYFAGREAGEPVALVVPLPPTPPAPPVPLRHGPVQPSAEAGDVVGLFPAPGGAS